MMQNVGLYIHIPFCFRKCLYCDFYSRAVNDELIEAYVEELTKEIRLISVNCNKTIDTVYMGGGTPSILDIKLLEKITQSVYNNFMTDIKEFTIEVNPCSSKNLQYYKGLGINRISLGVQSLNDDILKAIGRKHNKAEALEALERAVKYFNNVSCDLMLAIKGGERADNDINILKDYVKHISAYLLKVEDGTPLKKLVEKGKFVIPDEDEVVNQYETAYKALTENGFNRYEISNFAKKGYESIHNLKYWEMREYIGIGASAHSFYNGRRYYNCSSIEDYTKGKHSGKGFETEEKTDILQERIMLGLRLEKGININDINKESGINFLDKYKTAIHKMQNYIQFEGNNLRIKSEYMLLQNAIIVEFL